MTRRTFHAGAVIAYVLPVTCLAETLTICSFNVQFIGNSTLRDDAALADILRSYDIVVIQELVSPPYAGEFPNGDPFSPDPESAQFFDAMKAHGFDYAMSPEDTGTNDGIHINGSATEWWVCFFKSAKVTWADDLPSRFLAGDRSNHDDYERVPFAFAFRTADASMDFVLISVHLQQGSSAAQQARRKHELDAIADWIDDHDQDEKDFIILGDMNIQNAEELADATPQDYISLNAECRATNTNVNGPRPYDHVMIHPDHTTEADRDFDLVVVDLIPAMLPYWAAAPTGAYPGSPYDHNAFRGYYSDHQPIVFVMHSEGPDDDS